MQLSAAMSIGLMLNGLTLSSVDFGKQNIIQIFFKAYLSKIIKISNNHKYKGNNS